MHSCRSSLYCILPPYMLRNIVENGTPEQRQQALRNLVSAEAVRVQREVAAKEGPAEGLLEAVGGLERIVYTAQNAGNLPGQQLRVEGGPPTGDPAADEAYDGAGATYDLYKEAFNRNSIDDNGARLDSSVHYRVGYDNAFWNGRQMVYGDGDEDLPEADRLFNRFTIAVDIIGHELTHAVTQFTANLVYQGQPGALNESVSDVFGSLVKQRTLGHTAADAKRQGHVSKLTDGRVSKYFLDVVLNQRNCCGEERGEASDVGDSEQGWAVENRQHASG